MRRATCLVMLALIVGVAYAKPCPKCDTENDELAKFCKSGCGFEFQKAGDKVYVKGVADEAFDAGKWESAKRLYTLLLSLDPGNPLATARKAECETRIAEEEAAQRQREAEEKARIAREQQAREDAARAAREKGEYEAWIAGERKSRGYNVDTAKGALELGDHAGAAKYALKALAANWSDAEATGILQEALEKGTPAECCDVEGAFGSAPVAGTYRTELKREGAKVCAGIVLSLAGAAEESGDARGALGLFKLARRWDTTDPRAQTGVERCTPPAWEVEMVRIPGGTFQMGSSDDYDEKPVHTVAVSAFSMAVCEVTQRQYQAAMGNNPSQFRGEERPVEQASWYDAVLFCNRLSQKAGLRSCYYLDKKLTKEVMASMSNGDIYCDWSANGYRLPTEAEWEYACRAGTTTEYHPGSGESMIDRAGWYDKNSGGQTHDVGQKQANAWGLHDMHGNVWEWCWDWYGSYSSSSQTDPRGPSSGSGRVDRGGSWLNSARGCRSTLRAWADHGGRWYSLGLRLVRR